MDLKPNSNTNFKKSGTVDPNKEPVFTAMVLGKEASIRIWTKDTAAKCSFSPLTRGTKVGVCDAILGEDGKNWYYIKYNDKYGFVHDTSVYGLSKEQEKYLSLLETYHKFVKAHGTKFFYGYRSDMNTFDKVKKAIEKGKKVGMTCLMPSVWALHELGIKRSNGNSLVQCVNGSFANSYTGSVKKHLERIKKGGPVGHSPKDAIDKKLLRAGDICGFKNQTHTFVYSGVGYIFFEGGHASMDSKRKYYTGIKANYNSKYYNAKQINEVLRWK